MKFIKDGPQWTANPLTLYHLEALISLWTYSFVFQQDNPIEYDDDFPTLATWIAWYYPERKLLSDFLMVIGGENENDTLVRLCNMENTSRQNIVEIPTGERNFIKRDFPRNYIPIYLFHDSKSTESDSTWEAKHKESEIEPVFIPRGHIFGRERKDKRKMPGRLYAYKYPASPGTAFLGITNDSSAGR